MIKGYNESSRAGHIHIPVEFLPILLRLEMLAVNRGVIVLEIRLDRLVLLVEQCQIRYEVLDDVHYKPTHIHIVRTPTQPGLDKITCR